MGFFKLPAGLIPPPMTASERWERADRARQTFDQLKALWVQRHYAEEARDREITQQWQAERNAEAAELAALEGQEQGL